MPVHFRRYGLSVRVIEVLSMVLSLLYIYWALLGTSEPGLYLKRFDELSKGQQYRAMLAKLISTKTNVWFADEFCAYLDPVTANVVAHNVQRTARKLGITVVAAAPHCDNFLFFSTSRQSRLSDECMGVSCSKRKRVCEGRGIKLGNRMELFLASVCFPQFF